MHSDDAVRYNKIMDSLNLITSLNKISLVAFLITLAFIAYQFYNFKKELSAKKNKPKVPAFNENASIPTHYTKVIVNDSLVASAKKPSNLSLIIGIIFIIIFGLLSVAGIVFKKIPGLPLETKVAPTPIINLIASKGIVIFNRDWLLLDDRQIATLSSGQNVYIGIETIGETDIDRARIRINEKEWKTNAITMTFNKEKNVYYREYNISTGTAALTIEAQLHSATDGWLGD